jgi:ABC-2 type transport system ATP-binding protein
MDKAIETVGLRRTFGEVVAVDSLDLTVDAGTFFGFLGPNGAGKSTTIKVLTGLLGPSAGSARILGHDIMTEALEAKRLIGVVPEESALFERLTGSEYLRFVGRMYAMPMAVIEARTDEPLDRLREGVVDVDGESGRISLEDLFFSLVGGDRLEQGRLSWLV